jgi:hypothetical protein
MGERHPAGRRWQGRFGDVQMSKYVQEVLSGTRKWHVECADALVGLKEMEAGTVHTCVTSPPYFRPSELRHQRANRHREDSRRVRHPVGGSLPRGTARAARRRNAVAEPGGLLHQRRPTGARNQSRQQAANQPRDEWRRRPRAGSTTRPEPGETAPKVEGRPSVADSPNPPIGEAAPLRPYRDPPRWKRM